MRPKYIVEYAALRSVIFFINLFPVQLIMLFCTSVGWLTWVFAPFRLRVTCKNMSIALPDRTRSERMRLLRRAYIQICRTFGAVFILHRPSMRRMISTTVISGQDVVDQALAQGKGVILTTCHACWFEAFFAWFNASALPTTLIYQKQRNPLSNNFFLDQRRHHSGNNLEYITSNEKLSAYEEILQRGRLLIISLDQNYNKNGTPIPFFKHTLSCARGTGLLHLKTGAPVLTSVYYMKDGQMHIDFKKVELPEYQEVNEENINDICSRAIRDYESFFRTYPEQWFSLYHRLWSKKPDFYPEIKRTLREIFL